MDYPSNLIKRRNRLLIVGGWPSIISKKIALVLYVLASAKMKVILPERRETGTHLQSPLGITSWISPVVLHSQSRPSWLYKLLGKCVSRSQLIVIEELVSSVNHTGGSTKCQIYVTSSAQCLLEDGSYSHPVRFACA